MSESKFTLNPYDLDPNEDLVHTPVDVENWTEGFFFFGHDGARGISFVIHFAMVIGAPGLWQASVEVGLPNDQVLVTHTRGRSATKTGPGTGPLQVTSIEPMRSWRIEFDGALELTTRTALLEGLHQPGQPVPVRFEFTTTAAGPFWSTTAGGASLAKEVTDPRLAREFYIQSTRYDGHLAWGDQETDFNGVGIRDRSYGSRTHAVLETATWVNCIFDDGRALMLMAARIAGNSSTGGYFVHNDGTDFEPLVVTEGMLMPGDASEPGSIDVDPMADPEWKTFRVRFQGPRSGEQEIVGEVLHSLTTTYVPPIDELLGTAPEWPDRALQSNECPVRYTMNGEVAAGHLERINQLRHLRR